MYGIPVRSDLANQSVGFFYRELQEVEVYVEDVNAEALYTELLTRAVSHKIKIKKVISLGGRSKVVEMCKVYGNDFPAIFIVDGDLDLLVGVREQPCQRLFQHRLYCLENYLFCQRASAELMRDASGRLMMEDAVKQLEWDAFINYLTPILIELFKVYAISWKVFGDDRVKTVSRKYHTMCEKISKRRGHVICEDKVKIVIDDIKAKVLAVVNEEQYQGFYEEVTGEVAKFGKPFDAISGKDYLLKALRDHLAYKGASYNFDDSFKFKLARYCNLEPLSELGSAILHTVNIGPYVQAD